VVADPDFAGRRHVILESFGGTHQAIVRRVGGRAAAAASASPSATNHGNLADFRAKRCTAGIIPRLFGRPSAAGFL
jgi:hypothetical protein